MQCFVVGNLDAVTADANEAFFFQLAEQAREGFRLHGELGSDQALAGRQFDGCVSARRALQAQQIVDQAKACILDG